MCVRSCPLFAHQQVPTQKSLIPHARTQGFLWGRGTLDDKIGVIGILEAVEALIESSFVPQRSLFLAFGHDKEVPSASRFVGLPSIHPLSWFW